MRIGREAYMLGIRKTRVKAVLEIICAQIGSVFWSMKHRRFDPVG
jgi:hypothetical protein